MSIGCRSVETLSTLGHGGRYRSPPDQLSIGCRSTTDRPTFGRPTLSANTLPTVHPIDTRPICVVGRVSVESRGCRSVHPIDRVPILYATDTLPTYRPILHTDRHPIDTRSILYRPTPYRHSAEYSTDRHPTEYRPSVDRVSVGRVLAECRQGVIGTVSAEC